MGEVIESVKSGGSIAAPLRDAPVFPTMVAQMIAVGEETGNLDTMLSKVADFYEDEVAAAVKALTSILEPVMIMLVGGDRKSTRLNSSHANISYAVFCLKKKSNCPSH